MIANNQPNTILRTQLAELLTKAHAHATFNDAVENISLDDVSKKPNNLPYSIWQLVEHMRIAQWDILEFSRDANHKSPDRPEGYWLQKEAPADEEAWKNALEQIQQNCNEFIDLLNDEKVDLYKPFAPGTGQNLLREALLIADHNSYHIGQIILIRKLLNDWD